MLCDVERAVNADAYNHVSRDAGCSTCESSIHAGSDSLHSIANKLIMSEACAPIPGHLQPV